MKEITTSKGKLKYRSPNVPDTLRLLGRVRKKAMGDVAELSEEEWLSITIEEMDFLFDMSGMECDYQGLLNIDESAKLLIQVASEFFVKMGTYIKKKAASKTPSTPTQPESKESI